MDIRSTRLAAAAAIMVLAVAGGSTVAADAAITAGFSGATGSAVPARHTGASGDVEPPGHVRRSCSTVLEAEVCTWVRIESGSVVDLGATIPLSLIEAVPTDVEMTWPPEPLVAVPLPDEARSSLGIDHLGINWEAHGHPPATFSTPHFDFHFYNVTRERLGTMDCADESKPSRLPAGFALPDVEVPGLGMLRGLCVPHMGMHAMVEDEVEAAEPFEATMVIGYYGGEPVFFEPMVSRDRLLRRSDFTLDVPAVQGLPPGVHYPAEFSAHYDAADDQYRFILRGLSDR